MRILRVIAPLRSGILIVKLTREIRLAGRLLARDYRAGELTLIAVAIVVAVAAVTTVSFFANRARGALDIGETINYVDLTQRLDGDIRLSNSVRPKNLKKRPATEQGK